MTETLTCNSYTVWVGGSEVNDFVLDETQAWELASHYLADGYDDVVVACLGCEWSRLLTDADLEETTTLCPVAETAGEVHYFHAGTGQVIDWDVMGDPRTQVEVCAKCAEPLEGNQ